MNDPAVAPKPWYRNNKKLVPGWIMGGVTIAGFVAEIGSKILGNR